MGVVVVATCTQFAPNLDSSAPRGRWRVQVVMVDAETGEPMNFQE
jgi:hypothetical protein